MDNCSCNRHDCEKCDRQHLKFLGDQKYQEWKHRPEQKGGRMLEFETGANRNRKEEEIQFEGFLSPLAILMFGEYMHEHRHTSDGTVRSADNWQKGIPLDSYMDSLFRHVMDLWLIHRGYPEQARHGIREALCGAYFNLQGYMHETAKEGI